MNEKLDELVEFALTDGVLTEKEKQVLFKRAESLNVDLDEFEMVLEAKLFEKQKAVDQETQAIAAPSSDKLGDIRKCPACGSIAESFSTKCQDCGTEFRNIEASRNITKFFDKLNDIESTRKETSTNADDPSSQFTVGTILKWMFFYWFLIPAAIIRFFANKSKPGKWSTTDVRKEEMIINFPVPNSREELLEFLTLSLSKIDSIAYPNALGDESKYTTAWNKVWLKKINQIDTKASFSMKDDKETYAELQTLVVQARTLVENNAKRVGHVLGATAVALVALIIVLAVGV